MTTMKQFLIDTGQEREDADARREAARIAAWMRAHEEALRQNRATAAETKARARLLERIMREGGMTPEAAANWLENAERLERATALAEAHERKLREAALEAAGREIGAFPWRATAAMREASEQCGLKETKASPVALDAPVGTGHIAGLASPFGGQPDSAGDIVDAGAYTQAIADAQATAKARGKPFLWPILYQHDPTRIIGGITSAIQRAGGLYVEGQIDLDTVAGKEAYSLMSKGYLSGLSIGYRTRKDRYVGSVRHLLDIDLIEVSVVSFPAAPAAQVSSVGNESH